MQPPSPCQIGSDTRKGLAADGLERRLRIVRPSLPRWINTVQVEGLRVAGATVDLRFERADAGVTLADAKIDGDLEVVLEIAPERGVIAADHGTGFPTGRVGSAPRSSEATAGSGEG